MNGNMGYINTSLFNCFIWNIAAMKITSITALFALLLLCGCGNNDTAEPPTASCELMIRFFSSMRKADHASAVQQGVKLYALDNSQDAVIQLVMLEQANQYVTQAQKHLNKGNLKAAVEVLAEGMRNYPENKNLPLYHRKVRQLRNVKSLLDAMKRADNSASMQAALTAARIGLAANTTPKLEKYFQEYEKKIASVRENEKQTEKTPSLIEPELVLPKKAVN